MRFAQTPESGGAQVVSAADSPDEADWSDNPQDDNESDQSQLPSHTPRIVGQMKKLISQQAAASSNLDVDRLSSAYEMSRGFDALRKHLTSCVADLGGEEITSARATAEAACEAAEEAVGYNEATHKMVVAIRSELTDHREVDEREGYPSWVSSLKMAQRVG